MDKQLEIRWHRPWQNETGSSLFRDQLKNPSEVFSVMLIIGGDIVQKAIAQSAGRRITFIAFSFGWVAYSSLALMSAFGDGSLMPDPDYPASVILVSSRIKKSNNAWIIGRLIRDLEREVTNSFKKGEDDSALLVTFYKALPNAGSPRWGHDVFSFFGCLLIQLAVATIPTILYGNWAILLMTGIGTGLSVSTASLKEWRLEKYKCRRNTKHDYAITRGNGHPHVFIIRSGSANPGERGPGLFLDDLAGAVQKSDPATKFWSVCLSFFWICFLIIAGGIKNNTWFLLIVGLIGMAQNIWVAGRPRRPAAHGIPLEQIGETYGRKKQGEKRRGGMEVLKEVELANRGVGRALLPEFFPQHALRPQEIQWWANPPYPPVKLP